MPKETNVAAHYARDGLEAAILAGLRAAGLDPDRLAPADLAPVDEFHIGGREATEALAEQLDLRPGQALLDIGSGLGGASRHFAQAHGCRAWGIDLTADFVAVATSLAGRVGLADQVRYIEGSALALPFPAGTFDAATLLHVGMNIADKPALFAEARRVLKT
jgi:ubiquinone/menaquinone biosynthesis C-methylase UbiE